MPEEETEDLSPEEAAMLEAAIKSYGGSVAEEKHGVHVFLTNVANSNDTTKTGNLSEEEIGVMQLPLRTLKNCELYANVLAEDIILAMLFERESEIATSTSLSKNAKLLDLAVVQRREVADKTKRGGAKNSGWFQKKPKPEGES